MIKRMFAISSMALLCLSVNPMALAKGSTLVDGAGKPVKASIGCVKVKKSTKNDFHYSACHKIKPKKVK